MTKAKRSPLPTKSPTPKLKLGDRVEVIGGIALGARGAIVEAWPKGFEGVAQWVVDFGGTMRKRVIREDFLQRVEGGGP